MKKFYITTPIYYVNGKPHIGHAYTNIISDVISRFKVIDGYDVSFLTGTDEHGEKVEKASRELKILPKDFVDSISVNFRDLSNDLNISNTDFIRTTEPRHIEFVKKIWEKLMSSGNIYLGNYSGWYSSVDEAFYLEHELVNGKSPTGNEVRWLEEDTYFFKLSKWEGRLLKFYDDNPNFIMPLNRRNEVINFVKGGLKDLSISRSSFNWGIRVPLDSKHIIYVWIDALFNYLSALEDISFWPADVHVIGKDILRFHAVYWPALLMATGYELPKCILVHGWWTNKGEKISKSLGNIIDPYDLIRKYGSDYLRYYLIREISLTNDGNFSLESFIERINGELVNKVGNLLYRVTSFIYKNCNQEIPKNIGVLGAELLDLSYQKISRIRDLMDSYNIKSATDEILSIANLANVFIDENPPWKLKNIDVTKMYRVLYVCIELIRIIAILMQPFIPQYAKKILDYLKVNNRDFNVLRAEYAFVPGQELDKPYIIFNKIEL